MKRKILSILLSSLVPLSTTLAISCSNLKEETQQVVDISLNNFKFKNLKGEFVDSSQIEILKVIRENIQYDITGEDVENYNFKISKLKPDLDSKTLEIVFELRDKETNAKVGEISKKIIGFIGTKSGLTFKNFKFKNQYGAEQESKDIYAKDVNILNITYEAEGKNLDYYDHKIINARELNGDLEVFIDITLKNKAEVIETIKHLVTGFKKEGIYSQINRPAEKFDIDSYLALSQEERFQQDNKSYVDSILKEVIKKDPKYYRKLLSRDQNSIERFNQKAQELGIDSFENLLVKNFTLPSKDEGGKKLEIFDDGGRVLGPSKTDTFGVANQRLIAGLARKLINEKYRDIALQTFAISFINREVRNLQDRVNDIEEAFKLASEKLQKNDNSSSENDKKNVIVHLNNFYAKANIARKLAKEQGKKANIKQLEEIIANYEAEFNKLSSFKLFSRVPFGGESLNKKADESIFKKYIYKDFEADKYILRTTNGTIWILDAEIVDKEQYPTRFFFGTNAHVADAFGPNTISVSLTRANKTIATKQELKPNENDPHFETFNFPIHKQTNLKIKIDNLTEASAAKVIKNIFIAKDYLNSKPSDFLIKSQAIKYEKYEEFADFAIMGFDFAQISNLKDISINTYNDNGVVSQISKYNDVIKSAQSLAKYLTNDYASKENEAKQIKLLKESYLQNYQKIDSPLSGDIPNDIDSLYLLGYPSTQFDYYLSLGDKQYTYKKYRDNDKFKQSLWTNASSNFDSTDEIKHERGNRLSYQIGLRTFKEKPGIVDAFISTPNNNGQGFYQAPDGKQFINMGLEYTPRFYAPGGGASGSSLRNQNNEIIGAFHYKYGTYGEIGTGLAIALRSEGFDYQGLFGDYNLPQYDLIYGKGKDQKNSYRDELNKLYPGIKTYLLPNGASPEAIPAEFRFKKEKEENKKEENKKEETEKA
ncbi:Ig-specific serine endopeptidase MIP [Mycoplasma phocimorsus]|uniref:Ig-specific serine endopeptidase MIP n=1 Tax=Mycoplasma phocimorsus TaxID=3045839 RepID=UPI0024BFBA2F|nr:DUF31 family protein [Mycoplasma phocimorsus]MDJ1647541.1 DUF31 family protein [Mycoplasma phocimorsus]